MTWQDSRPEGGSSNDDIYAQRIDGNGNRTWDTNDVDIGEGEWPHRFPRLASDDAAGALIVWKDDRGSASKIYVQPFVPKMMR